MSPSNPSSPSSPSAAGDGALQDALDFLQLDADLGEEERLARDAVARVVDQRVLPIIADCFEAGRFPRELIPALAEIGVFGATIRGYGCAGLSAASYGLICRELERGDSAMRSLVSVQSSLCMYPIDRYGSEDHKQRWLPRMARGEAIGCFGLTEAHGGSDPANLRTSARRSGSDWLLSGSKMWITNGPIADVALVWARAEDGIRGFLVERGMRGFSAREIGHKFSLRASSTGALFFDEVRLPAEAALPGAIGLAAPLSCLSQARYGICWGVLGAAQACVAEVLAHAGERTLFGRPLQHTQAVQIRLAEMVRALCAGQALATRLAQLKEANGLTAAQISLAKWNNCRAALQIARDCRDLLGAAGISVEHAAIRHMLNLESVVTYEGTQTIHQLAVGRAITGVAAF
ncbi:MAG TPA: acyl-CoA dehydrogenase family protein [Steroidobacteraceae bacterium]|jgi:glutaryl-CoA dehydrogenase|nr:acyl-CoA dehydrogenase family protein [Steroidobacteraceae bacterium]